MRARPLSVSIVIVAALTRLAGCEIVAGIDERSVGVRPDGGGPTDGLDATADVAQDAKLDGGGGTGTEGGASANASCDGLGALCGPAGSDDCCGSSVVPAGSFLRSYDGVTYTDQGYPATVSEFRLDTYLVTVGRFRKFVAAYPGNLPPAGAGKHPRAAGDPGWDATWASAMPATQADLVAALKCDATDQTWTDAPGGNELKAISCVTWYEAFAFCLWDGGRMPSEAEWNYAAAGGSEQRVYPWSVPPTSSTIDSTYAVYGSQNVSPVGSKPKGNAKWGHADMAGNLYEWLLDWYRTSYGITTCNDCVDVSTATSRVHRGGGAGTSSQYLATSFRWDHAPTFRGSVGVRCARNP